MFALIGKQRWFRWVVQPQEWLVGLTRLGLVNYSFQTCAASNYSLQLSSSVYTKLIVYIVLGYHKNRFCTNSFDSGYKESFPRPGKNCKSMKCSLKKLPKLKINILSQSLVKLGLESFTVFNV